MFKDEIIHFVLSVIAGAIIGYFYHNFWAIPVALISGFLIDGDHLIDYFIFTKFKHFSLKEFRTVRYFDLSGKVYVIFHGYEYAIASVILGLSFPSFGWLFYSLALSNFFHLIYDTISNKPIWPTYLILYRIAKNFNQKTFKFKCQR